MASFIALLSTSALNGDIDYLVSENKTRHQQQLNEELIQTLESNSMKLHEFAEKLSLR